MKMWKIFAYILVAFSYSTLVTPIAFASVTINEIAWMGSVHSSTDEWIELYNSDITAIDLSGWRIVADDGSPGIVLSGEINPGAYFLIERTDDSSVPGVSADLIAAFGSGLSNSGETIRLKSANDAEVDIVVGGVNWVNTGGDNATKETAQRTINSWISGIATPRAQNVAAGGVVLGVNTTDSATSTDSTFSNAAASTVVSGISKPSLYPRNNIVVEAGSDIRALSGFPVTFSGSSTGLFNEPLTRATYRWNFGDGTEASNQLSTHIYDFPGEYVVTLEVFWATHHERDRLLVTVSNPEVKIVDVVPGVAGYVRLENTSMREVDISGWTLNSNLGQSTFVFPPNSLILPKKSFILSNKVTGMYDASTSLRLHFPLSHGGIATTWEIAMNAKMPASPQSLYKKEQGTVAGANDIRKENSPSPVSTKPNVEKGIVDKEPVATSTVAATVLWDKSGSRGSFSESVASENGFLGARWLFALLAVVLVIVAGFVIVGSRAGEVTVEDEYAIIEDIIQGKEDFGVK